MSSLSAPKYPAKKPGRVFVVGGILAVVAALTVHATGIVRESIGAHAISHSTPVAQSSLHIPAVFSVLYTFLGTEGAEPIALLTDGANILYGATSSGLGNAENGTVFKLDAKGAEDVLYTFSGGEDGGGPESLILGSDGDLYGAAQSGGAHNYGVVFKLDHARRESVLYNFSGGSDGGLPTLSAIDTEGNLYGATREGGDSGCNQGGGTGCGVVYELKTNGDETVLHAFAGGKDGAFPSGVIRDAEGNLYGAVAQGGNLNCLRGNEFGCGALFRLDAAGGETVLYNFHGGAQGQAPYGALLMDQAGNLYGTTTQGGDLACTSVNNNGCGIAFELTASGDEVILHEFKGYPDGAEPNGDLIMGPGGFYGTAMGGGNGYGTVFKVDADGRYATIYSFSGGVDGAYPRAGLVAGSAGVLYGPAFYGGDTQCEPLGCGTVYQLTAK